MNSCKVQEKNQQKNDSEHNKADTHSFYGNIKSKYGRNVKQLQKQQKRQFASENSGCNATGKGEDGGDHSFHKHDDSNMTFFQAENIVKADFFLPSFHQKTVTVNQKNNTEDLNDDFACGQEQTYFISMSDGLIQCWAVAEKLHHINHGNTENTGDHIRNIGAFIVSDVLACQT